jgi:hypothetical protein
MAEDASLDDFLDGSDSEDEGDGSSAAEDEAEELESEPTDSGSPTDGVDPDSSEASTGTAEPAVTTYAWSPSGAACAECGEVVERRWTQDGDLVCGACKSW